MPIADQDQKGREGREGRRDVREEQRWGETGLSRCFWMGGSTGGSTIG